MDARVGLAILQMHGDSTSKTRDTLDALKLVYDLHPFRPTVLNIFASHFFFRKEYSKVRSSTLARASSCIPMLT